MSTGAVQVPDGARGRVGLVAMLRRVATEVEGRLVAVRLPVGFVSSLGGVRPVFAWQVLVLGDPVDLDGKACREVVVADTCLEPVSHIEPDQVEEMVKAGLYRDFDEAMAKVHTLLATRALTPEELDAEVERAAEEATVRYALEVVPVDTALRDLTFRLISKDSTTLHWSGMHQGVELYVFAGTVMFGRWIITGKCVTARKLMWDEHVLADREPRGRVALHILKLWRSAFGRDAPAPGNLQLALVYERHLADIKQLEIGLPTLKVDGEILRATRRWIAQRHGQDPDEVGPPPDRQVTLAFRDGLLRFEIDGEAYGCPAHGVWLGDCQVSLMAFLAMPHWHLRGFDIKLVRSLEAVTFTRYEMPLRPER